MNRHWILRRPNALIGTVLLATVVVMAIIGIVGTSFDPLALSYEDRMQPPSWKHWLGTDQFGRDGFARLMAAASTSLMVSFLTVAFALSLGSVVGIISGFLGGRVDRFTMMIVDAFMAFPGILLALSIMAIIGPQQYGVVLALGLAYAPNVVRVARGTVLSLKQKEFIEASRALGNSELYTMLVHVAPNCISPLTVIATSIFGGALMSESALSFLGLGVPPPAPTFGGLLSDARLFMESAPWLSIFPGIAISVALLGINLFGDALRDKFDPRMNQL
ncbi:ABC transporter permease [Kordiimonas sp.]|uniref:ABC transporter permease n=1 Tax=Kordiimonas sp. TaxID=1970157 RepID=UPI003A8D9A6B